MTFSRWIRGLLVVVFIGIGFSMEGLATQEPNKNPWWPLMPGNSWTLRRSDNGHPLTISVQSTVPRFGCGTDVLRLLFEKQDTDAYWGPGLNLNLDWYLGVDPNGDIRGYGHSLHDLTGKPVGGVMNYRSQDPSIPAYFIVPGRVTNGQSVSNRHSLPSSTDFTNDCLPADNVFYSTWNVVWTLTTINTPAYKGPALKASYDESSGGRQIEDWYFAPGIGIARIVTRSADGKVGVDMQLASYHLNRSPSSRPTSPPPPSSLADLSVDISRNGLKVSPAAILDVSVGDNLTVAWSSARAKSLVSYIHADGLDACRDGIPAGSTQQPWLANLTQGALDFQIQPCQAGRTYFIVLQAISSTGDVTPVTLSLRVGSVPDEPVPSAFVSLSQFGHNNYGIYSVGDPINFIWNTSNVARVESYYYATASDNCANSFGPTDTTKTWFTRNQKSGVLSVKIQPCQAARAYTVTVVGYSASGRQVARDQVIYYVKGSVEEQMGAAGNTLPQSWDTWAYYFQSYSGEAVADLTSFVSEVDPTKRFDLIPLDVWWRCTQESDCADLSSLFAPEVSDDEIGRTP